MNIKSKMLFIHYGIILLLVSGITYSGQAVVPHTFVSDDVARASEVNDNFTALVSEINTLHARMDALESQLEENKALKLYDNDDNRMGTVVDQNYIQPDLDAVRAISQLGFIFQMEMADGKHLPSVNFYFADVQCSTQAYANLRNDGQENASNMVFPAWEVVNAPLYYVTRGATLESSLSLTYRLTQSGCVSTGGLTQGYPVYPNIEAVTGVSNITPSLPLRIGY